VTQLSTGANSHYNGLQLTADKRLAHGLQVQANYTWSHCMDTVSNGGFLPFAAGPFFRRCRASWAANTAPAITTCATTSRRSTFISCRSNSGIALLAGALNGWQVSGTAFWHSGLPFSVLSAPYSANGNGIVQGSGPQYASVVPGVPLYEHNPIPGVTQPGRSSGSTPTRSFRPSIRAPAPVPAATVRRIASSAISAGTRCAVPISSGAICI
jgi:hypothetical protein